MIEIDDNQFVINDFADYVADLWLSYREFLLDDSEFLMVEEFIADMNQLICQHRECELNEDGICRICGSD